MKNRLNFWLSIFIVPVLTLAIAGSCKKNEDPKQIPVLTTAVATYISSTTAISGGTITSDGGAQVTERGVCWSVNPDPTIADFKLANSLNAATFSSTLTNLATNTTYYVRAYAVNEAGTGYGNNVTFKTIQIPVVATANITNITQFSLRGGGTVTSPGGLSITERGICWGSVSNPTVKDSKKSEGSGTGDFVVAVSGLDINTTYYVRAYAVSVEGTVYGNEIIIKTLDYGTVSDFDGYIYKTVTFGTQTWMAENLKVSHYNNGTAINTTQPSTLNISGEVSPKYQWPGGGYENNVALYGRLYTWYVVTDSRGICPAGWHIPTIDEYTILENYLISRGYNFDGSLTGNKTAKAMASAEYWDKNTSLGTVGNTDYPEYRNRSKFSALPAGDRGYYNTFVEMGKQGFWWTTSNYDTNESWLFEIGSYEIEPSHSVDYKWTGNSVRCVKD